jgi:hypothetical protein
MDHSLCDNANNNGNKEESRARTGMRRRQWEEEELGFGQLWWKERGVVVAGRERGGRARGLLYQAFHRGLQGLGQKSNFHPQSTLKIPPKSPPSGVGQIWGVSECHT